MNNSIYNPFEALLNEISSVKEEIKSIKALLSEKSDDLPDWMTREQVKDYLQYKTFASVDGLARKGLLKKHYIGGSVRFAREDVKALFEKLRA